jgi:hypothetical protein
MFQRKEDASSIIPNPRTKNSKAYDSLVPGKSSA